MSNNVCRSARCRRRCWKRRARTTPIWPLRAKLIPVLQAIAGRYDATTHDAELRRAIDANDIVRKAVHFTKPAQLVVKMDARVAFRSAANTHADSAMVSPTMSTPTNNEDDDDDSMTTTTLTLRPRWWTTSDARVRCCRCRLVRSTDLALSSATSGGTLFFTDLVGSARRPVLFHRRLPLRLDWLA
jgi:hypothetical protein